MNPRAIAIAGLVVLSLISSRAFAETGEPAPFYGAARLGAAFLESTDLEDNINTADADFDSGFFASGAIGYELITGRVELEVGYRQNDLDKVKFQGLTFHPGGNFSALSFLFNSFADFHNRTGFTPYACAGLGFALVSIDEDALPGVGIDDTEDLVFAYQGGAGVGYAVSKMVTLDLEYRYFATLEAEFEASDGSNVKADYATHNVLLGARISF